MTKGGGTGQLRWIWQRDRGICHLCDWPCAFEDATRDHVIPRAAGGLAGWQNLALAHTWCNNQKSDGKQFTLRPDAWLSVARAIIAGEPRTWFEPVPEDIRREAIRLAERGYRRQRRVPRSLANPRRKVGGIGTAAAGRRPPPSATRPGYPDLSPVSWPVGEWSQAGEVDLDLLPAGHPDRVCSYCGQSRQFHKGRRFPCH